jgi:hypothetical protein
MTNQLTYGNSAALLSAAGYVPVPLSDGGPAGPVFVRQLDFGKWPESAALPVAVLTWVPAPRFDADPVQDHTEIRLATLTVHVRPEWLPDVDAIIAKYTLGAKCPVRIADDGSLLFVFQLTGEPFATVQTHHAHAPDRAVIESGPQYIPLAGNWRDGIDLLDCQRGELPQLDGVTADAMVKEINALLSAQAAPYVPPVYTRPAILQPGQRLLYGNSRALTALEENGFKGALPVRWGDQQAERDGYADAVNNWIYKVSVSKHGVGVPLKGLVTIETVTPFRPDVDAIIRGLGACLVRTVVGDESRRLYVFRSNDGGADQGIYSPCVHLAARRKGFLVLSGADEDGREYKWDSDLIQTRVDQLSAFEYFDAPRLQSALEPLPYIKRARRRA